MEKFIRTNSKKGALMVLLGIPLAVSAGIYFAMKYTEKKSDHLTPLVALHGGQQVLKRLIGYHGALAKMDLAEATMKRILIEDKSVLNQDKRKRPNIKKLEYSYWVIQYHIPGGHLGQRNTNTECIPKCHQLLACKASLEAASSLLQHEILLDSLYLQVHPSQNHPLWQRVLEKLGWPDDQRVTKELRLEIISPTFFYSNNDALHEQVPETGEDGKEKQSTKCRSKNETTQATFHV
ncbi:hypothetical protein AAG906_015027 [Vitis piasezkii]